MLNIDLRSDTVTRPTPAMLQAMMGATVGDDVFEDDPTVHKLEEKAAALFGKEAALFCASGTMTNQIAIKVHTQPADEVICANIAHIYSHEGGGIAFNSGASVRLLEGDRGRLNARDILDNINPDNVHYPRTSLVALENTVNKGGGCYYNLKDIITIRETCLSHGLILHLDGARIFNALVETGESPMDYGRQFDTISICLSKGLGAPVGSLLLGSAAHIYKARRIRKIMGGGWRQAGYLAAAGIYALDNNIARLKEDHKRASFIYETLVKQPYIDEMIPQETNIIIFKLKEEFSSSVFMHHLEAHGIKASPFGKSHIRMVTHLDITDDMLPEIEKALVGFGV